MHMTRRTLRFAAGWFVSIVIAHSLVSPALAQSYPSKPVTLIVPFSAGSNVDAAARLVAPELAKRLGQNVIVENVAGAGGIIGTERAARSVADGHTLLLSGLSTIVIAKLVKPAVVKYDGAKDFTPVTLLATSPLVLVGRPGLPANTIDELLKLLKKDPGKYTYATSGIGTSLHLAGEMFNQMGQVQMVHVPYSGAQIVTDLIGNRIDLAMVPVPSVSQHVKSGSIKAFGITEAKRSAALPDVPSLSDHPQLKGVDVTAWLGIFAPAKTDASVVARLNLELADVLKDNALRQKFSDIGMPVLILGPDAFANLVVNEQRKFGEIVRAGNIKAE